MKNKLLQIWNNLAERQLIWILAAVSCLLTCRLIYIQQGWINDDSVLYFEMARLISLDHWKEAISLFNWPLYPLLLSTIHQIFHLPIQTSAQLLDIVFFVITTISFTKLIQLAGGNKTVMVTGAIILFSSSYIAGDVLPMLLRDQGFWAMFLSSLVFFIEFYRHKKLEDAIYWQIFAIAAVLFRIEAITFLAGIPLILLCQKSSLKDKLHTFLKANSLALVLLVLVCMALLMPTIHIGDFGRLSEVATIVPRLMTGIADTLKAKAAIMSKDVLGSFLDDYGLFGLIVTLLSIILFKCCNLLSWPLLGVLALHNRMRKETDGIVRLDILKDTRVIFYWVCTLALINAAVITVTVYVISSRYLVALILILYIFAAFALAALIQDYHGGTAKRWHKGLLLLAIAFLGITSIKNVLPKQTGYTYEQDAAAYIKQHHIPNSQVFYVSPRLRYFTGSPYAGRGYDYWEYTKAAIEDGSIYRFNYLTINLNIDNEFVNREEFLKQKLADYQVVEEFYGYRKKKKITLYSKIKQ